MTASLRARIFLVVLALIALLAATGCASQNRETFVRESAGEFVYRRPLPEVLAAAKALLAEDGYTGREEKEGAVYITEWKQEGGESSVSARYTRYLVQGKQIRPDQSIVRIVVIARASGATGAGLGDPTGNTHAGMASIGPPADESAMSVPQSSSEGIGQKSTLSNGRRDLGMEWRLLQKLEPTQAQKIEAEAVRQYPE